MHDATTAISNKVSLRKEALIRLPNPGMMAIAATGTDSMDLALCRERRLPAANVRHVCRLLAYCEDVRKGR